MLQITLHLTRSNRLWTFQLLGFEVFQFQLQKKVLQPFLNGIIYCFYLSMVVKGMKIILNFLLIAAVKILVKM
jgi:hypothetical protein